MSPTARTLKMLRAQGWLAEVVERWIPRAGVRKDLFGFVDIVAINPAVNVRTIGIQCTSGSNVAARVAKIRASPNLKIVKLAGWWIIVHGWRKNIAGRWVCRVVEVT